MTTDNKYKVLLVEDDENISRLFSYNIKKSGYECELAVNGREGFDLTKSFKPDIIISDIMMPEVDGFEFREMLLNDPDLRAIPFIFLTAKGAEEDILKGYDLDIQEYIIKTASPKIIMAKLSAILKSGEKERIKAEGEVQKAADSMGAKVVPDAFPNFDGFVIKHWHVPFHNIPGGDFIDYFKIDENNIVIILGDVMGKKWGAWYFAVAYAGYVRSAIRFAVQSNEKITASEIMNRVNASLCEDERISEVFVTLSVVLLNKSDSTANYCGAGDLPIIYYDGSEASMIKSKGLLLGFSKDAGYEDVEIKLKPGDELYMITDGILESRNANSVPYENEGIIKSIKQKSDEDSVERVKREFTEYTQGKFEDDVSLIYVKMN
ncbi:MAG: SpoIIE family protein phosphatase [Bacteroidetes bacterium]|nr:SpoIIE family protein phosphatase [Bacteroidota bacterium]MBU1679072.1 SpoIIE family protein phosphatase [Bacteroidota bacterium]MBU2507175.1 SpoIIE family protein phosphatase [Bacteroidota bacterium]